jgi:hypothetical protein
MSTTIRERKKAEGISVAREARRVVIKISGSKSRKSLTG